MQHESTFMVRFWCTLKGKQHTVDVHVPASRHGNCFQGGL